MILTKRWSLRPKDVDDIAMLEELKQGGGSSQRVIRTNEPESNPHSAEQVMIDTALSSGCPAPTKRTFLFCVASHVATSLGSPVGG